MPKWLGRLLPYIWPIRIALGVMFLISSASALSDLNAFLEEVRQYGLLPEPLPILFGYAMPFAELAVGIMSVLGLFTRLAAAGGALMMISFMIAIAYRLIRIGEGADCGCFGLLGKEPLTWLTFGRDLVFLAVLGLVFLDRAHWFSLDRYLFGWGEDTDADTEELDVEDESEQVPPPSPQATS